MLLDQGFRQHQAQAGAGSLYGPIRPGMIETGQSWGNVFDTDTGIDNDESEAVREIRTYFDPSASLGKFDCVGHDV